LGRRSFEAPGFSTACKDLTRFPVFRVTFSALRFDPFSAFSVSLFEVYGSLATRKSSYFFWQLLSAWRADPTIGPQ